MNHRGERIKPAVRRASWTYTIQTKGDFSLKAHVTIGLYGDSSPCEIFVNVAKSGSVLRTTFESWAMTASRSLQHGVPASQIVRAIRDVDDGTCTRMIHHDDTITDCSSMWDAIAQLLERHIK